MNQYIPRANINHYLGLLQGNLTAQGRTSITKLLIAEEDKLAHDLEHFEFAESKAAESRDRVNRIRLLRASFCEGSSERADADRLLENAEGIHELIERFCHQFRSRLNPPPL